jgi:CubicO group peptidase (beta-lactamase class C family)
MKKSLALIFAASTLILAGCGTTHQATKWEYRQVYDFSSVQKLAAEGWTLEGFHSFGSSDQETMYILQRRVLPVGRRENQASTTQYAAPEKTKDGWETASLNNENLDANLIKELFERVGDNTYKNIHSVLLVKNGKLVVEEYFPGKNCLGQYWTYTRDTLHDIQSVTKSVNSILVGIAIDQHLITGVDEKISAFFPDYADIFTNQEKDAICLKHLLSMTAGLAWDESTYPYTDARNDALKALLSPDPIRYTLERPMVAAPGAKFAYNTGIALVLGEIIYKASGLRADKFAERYLFEPLGISDYYWEKTPNGSVNTGGGLMLRPRDMAKIGQLLLNGGRRQGKQIVSEGWVKESTKPQSGAGQLPTWVPEATGYRYQWLLGSFHVYDQVIGWYGAAGRGGQFVAVFPDLQMVAVFTGWNDNALLAQPIDMLQRYILPAAIPQSPDKNAPSAKITTTR